jgi:hypothetical protein
MCFLPSGDANFSHPHEKYSHHAKNSHGNAKDFRTNVIIFCSASRHFDYAGDTVSHQEQKHES